MCTRQLQKICDSDHFPRAESRIADVGRQLHLDDGTRKVAYHPIEDGTTDTFQGIIKVSGFVRAEVPVASVEEDLCLSKKM